MIQVFASLGENTALEVTALRGQVDALREENQALKRGLAAVEARLAALEQIIKGSMTVKQNR